MISPPTDRLHKFLVIAGTALFILGVTIPLERYDQAVRQFIEARAEAARLEREIADLSIQARKQGDLAEHADRIRSVWLVLGCLCILGGMALAALGFATWWRQPAHER